MNAMTQAPGMTILGGALPGWVVLAAAAVAAVCIFLLFLRAESMRLPLLLAALIGLLVVAFAAGSSVQNEVRTRALDADIDALEARAVAVDAALATSGLGCLDATGELADDCEAVLFARPESVAAARALVRARLQLADDAHAIVAGHTVPALAERLAGWRRPLERDPYGFVAVVLAEDFACGDARCDAASALTDNAQVAANMRDQRFAGLLAKHTAEWERHRQGASVAPAPVPDPPAQAVVPAAVAEPPPPPEPLAAPAPEDAVPEQPVPTAIVPLPAPRPSQRVIDAPVVARPRPTPPRPAAPSPAAAPAADQGAGAQ